MARGGRRDNSGRKKIGDKQVKITLSLETIDKINDIYSENTLTERIRRCIAERLDFQKKE